jgi:hypothetical protein
MSRLFGGLLLAAGILIATLSGLCSLGFLIFMVSNNSEYGARDANGVFSTLALMAMFGGPPIGLGAALIYAGRRILRRSDSIDPSDTF